jgi:mRNA-degrading endonuclease RelE of RelBE toxin-antitoxin system
MIDRPAVEIRISPEFERNLRYLAKKYRSVKADLLPVIQKIELGKFVGDQVKRTGFTVLKVRVKNSNIQKGQSGGYRLIYQVETPKLVLFVTLYSKSDQADVSAKEIRAAIAEYQMSNE